MALIECTECGKQVSDKARSCPHCGCPAQPSPRCPECGEPLVLRGEACSSCGCPVAKSEPLQPGPAPVGQPAGPGVVPPSALAPKAGVVSPEDDTNEEADFRPRVDSKRLQMFAAAGAVMVPVLVGVLIFKFVYRSDCEQACDNVEAVLAPAGYGYSSGSGTEHGRWKELDQRQCRFDCERDERRHPGHAACLARAKTMSAQRACSAQ